MPFLPSKLPWILVTFVSFPEGNGLVLRLKSISVMEPKWSISKIFRKSCGWRKPFFWFLLTPKVSKITDLIIFHTGIRWVAYTGNQSFSCHNKHPFTFFLCFLLATLWLCRNLMLILLIRSITQDVLTSWTGSSALDIGKSQSPDMLVLFYLFISSHNLLFIQVLLVLYHRCVWKDVF